MQPFRLRTELLDAFAALRVPAAIGVTRVRLSLSIRDLPGPLRLPALFDGDWWLDSGWVAIKNPTPMKNAAPMKNAGAKP